MNLEKARDKAYRYAMRDFVAFSQAEQALCLSKLGQKKKAYRLRYGNLSKAWNFVDAHLEVAIDNYRKTVDHLQNLMEKQRKGK